MDTREDTTEIFQIWRARPPRISRARRERARPCSRDPNAHFCSPPRERRDNVVLQARDLSRYELSYPLLERRTDGQTGNGEKSLAACRRTASGRAQVRSKFKRSRNSNLYSIRFKDKIFRSKNIASKFLFIKFRARVYRRAIDRNNFHAVCHHREQTSDKHVPFRKVYGAGNFTTIVTQTRQTIRSDKLAVKRIFFIVVFLFDTRSLSGKLRSIYNIARRHGRRNIYLVDGKRIYVSPLTFSSRASDVRAGEIST